jgi:hypothetical protein
LMRRMAIFIRLVNLHKRRELNCRAVVERKQMRG